MVKIGRRQPGFVLIFMPLLIGTLIMGWLWRDRQVTTELTHPASWVGILPDDALGGFDRADSPYIWSFPRDHGPHPNFQTEWWYFTGNLATAQGRHFGYQLTFFRRSIVPQMPESSSEWRTNQIYLGHFTISDVASQRFFHTQRISRGTAGLAGGTSIPEFSVWLEDWRVSGSLAPDDVLALVAVDGDMQIALQLTALRTPVLQGEDGLSKKSTATGNASYYYSITRLQTSGTVTVAGTTYQVTGTSWMDHEFSTGALDADAEGWDWFGLHLDDGRDVMVGWIRRLDGGTGLIYGGVIVNPDGAIVKLGQQDFRLSTTQYWTSSATNTRYPAAWTLDIFPDGLEPIRLSIRPLMANQEVIGQPVIYWEGAVEVSGDASGCGYAELTGYHTPMRGWF